MLKPFLLLLILMMSVAFDSQKYVTIEARIQSGGVENGLPFLLLIEMKPIGGVHLNAQPPISVKSLDESATMVVKEVPKSGDYLDSSKPVEIECKINGVDVGKHKLSFVIGYTYCSEKDGWCRMGKDTVSVTVRVKK